ncbi:putative membrane protein [Chryseobacterium shigense]|uniref:Putative membrane protein n=1 Tax=Chryseobacterium shigense TaxID=297244 RepID=A0A841NDF1_9FLAO|nr:putative membrane protein [Chryseobacterium shigense]
MKIDLFNNIFDLKLGFIISFYYIVIALAWLLKKNYYFDGEKIINNPLYWISLSQIVWASFFMLRTVPMYYFNESSKSILNFSKILFIAGNYFCLILYSFAYFQWKKKKNNARKN